MKLGKVKVLVAGLAIILVSSVTVMAQVDPNLESGVKNFGSYQGGDVDVVNLANGNVTVKIPLAAYGQRGSMPAVGYVLLDNGKKWSAVKNAQLTVVPDQWVVSQNALAVVTSLDVRISRTRVVSTNASGVVTEMDYGYTVTDPDGAVHSLSGPNGTAIDTSGWQFTLIPGGLTDHSNDTGLLIDRKGTHYKLFKPLGPSTTTTTGPGGSNTTTTYTEFFPVVSTTDASGNIISGSTDTLGRSLNGTVLTSDLTGCTSARTITKAWLLNLPGVNGGTTTIKLCGASLTVSEAFSQPNVGPPQTTQMDVIVEALLPDGRHWSFDYDSFANVTSITYPMGGTVTYQWQEIGMSGCDDGTDTQVSRAVQSRTINDGAASRTWNYTWGAQQTNGTRVNVTPILLAMTRSMS